MTTKTYTAEFKAEAVKQVLERGHRIVDVGQRLGISGKSLGRWVREARQAGLSPTADDSSLRLENTRLKAELKRTSEERDILKKAVAYFAKVPG
jgi:transposase